MQPSDWKRSTILCYDMVSTFPPLRSQGPPAVFRGWVKGSLSYILLAVNMGCEPWLDVAQIEHNLSAVVWCSMSLSINVLRVYLWLEFYSVLQMTYFLIVRQWYFSLVSHFVETNAVMITACIRFPNMMLTLQWFIHIYLCFFTQQVTDPPPPELYKHQSHGIDTSGGRSIKY